MARAADRQRSRAAGEHLLKDMQVALVGAAEATVRQQNS
jgi:hypothetical protein